MHCCYADVITIHTLIKTTTLWHKIVHINPRLPHSYNDEVRFHCISAFTTNQLHLMKISIIVIIVSATLWFSERWIQTTEHSQSSHLQVLGQFAFIINLKLIMIYLILFNYESMIWIFSEGSAKRRYWRQGDQSI